MVKSTAIFKFLTFGNIMKNTFKFSARATAAAAVMALGSSAFAINFDANLELDNTYRSGSYVTPDKDTKVENTGLSQSGRVEMNASGKAGTNLFVAGRASFLAKKDGSVGTDDMWVQVGSATSALKLGRFEAADLFPLAGDTLVNHAGTVYGTNLLRGRNGNDKFHAAATTSLGNGLSFEFGVVETNDPETVTDATTSIETSTVVKGIRPVVSYAVGAFSLSAALESGKYIKSGRDISGAGATASYNLGAAKLTGNLAMNKRDAATRNAQSAFALTVAAGGLSVGVISATNEADVGEDKVSTVYASYSMPLFDIKGASVTPAISSSTGKTGGPSGKETSENSLRVRLNYAF